MRIYIACHSKESATDFAETVPEWVSVVSRWHSKEFLPTENHTESERYSIAIEDANDIRRADALVLIAGDEKYSGGKFVEAGIAYGLGKPVYVVGRRENMLTYLFEPWPEEWRSVVKSSAPDGVVWEIESDLINGLPRKGKK